MSSYSRNYPEKDDAVIRRQVAIFSKCCGDDGHVTVKNRDAYVLVGAGEEDAVECRLSQWDDFRMRLFSAYYEKPGGDLTNDERFIKAVTTTSDDKIAKILDPARPQYLWYRDRLWTTKRRLFLHILKQYLRDNRRCSRWFRAAQRKDSELPAPEIPQNIRGQRQIKDELPDD